MSFCFSSTGQLTSFLLFFVAVYAQLDCTPNSISWFEPTIYPVPGGCTGQNEGGILNFPTRNACLQACLNDPECIATEYYAKAGDAPIGQCQLSHSCTLEAANLISINDIVVYNHLICPPPDVPATSKCLAKSVTVSSTWPSIGSFDNSKSSTGSSDSIEVTTGMSSTSTTTQQLSVGVSGPLFKILSVDAGYQLTSTNSLTVTSSTKKTVSYQCSPFKICNTFQNVFTFEFILDGKAAKYSVTGGLMRIDDGSSPPQQETKSKASSLLPDDVCEAISAGVVLSVGSNIVMILMGLGLMIF